MTNDQRIADLQALRLQCLAIADKAVRGAADIAAMITQLEYKRDSDQMEALELVLGAASQDEQWQLDAQLLETPDEGSVLAYRTETSS